MKLSEPENPLLGVYVTCAVCVPAEHVTLDGTPTTPFAGDATIEKPRAASQPSTSVARNVTATAVPLVVVALVFAATGASFTALTVIVAVALPLVSDPSPTLYVNESDPLKFEFGV